jgi:hypothetical protein
MASMKQTVGDFLSDVYTWVVGGPKSFEPWVVALRRSDNQRCTGAVVGSNVILTAAHCLRDTNDVLDLVRPGRDLLLDCCRPATFLATPVLDIAVCWPRDGTPLGITPKPLRRAGVPAIGAAVTYYGVGCFTLGDGTFGTQRQGRGTVDSHLDGVIGVRGHRICQSDSGGPMMEGDAIIGILSRRPHLVQAWSVTDARSVAWLDSLPQDRRPCFDDGTVTPCGP